MQIQIASVNMRYENGEPASVQVFFNGHDEERQININGYVPLSAAEYAGNESLPALATVVRQQVSAKLLDQSAEG